MNSPRPVAHPLPPGFPGVIPWSLPLAYHPRMLRLLSMQASAPRQAQAPRVPQRWSSIAPGQEHQCSLDTLEATFTFRLACSQKSWPSMEANVQEPGSRRKHALIQRVSIWRLP